MSVLKAIGHHLAANQFLLLLASLVVVLLVAPLTEDTRLGAVLLNVGLDALFILGVYINRKRKWILRMAIVVAVISIPLTWSTMLFDFMQVSLGFYVAVVVSSTMTAIVILIAIFDEHLGAIQSVLAAICVYLLIGLIWAMVYSAIDFTIEDAFAFNERRMSSAHGHTDFSQLVYFSFVTMSTLGYGDVNPRTPLAETATWMQSVVGQLYIAILIARLVSELPRKGRDR